MASAAAKTLGLYLSVPFCRAKCSFCNFSSGVGTSSQMELYVAALCRQIREARQRAAPLDLELPQRVDTVYFGGGTPSLLQPQQLADIFAALRENFVIVSGAEITMEAAPGQVTADLLQAAQRQGVNRVSLGVQSLVDSEASSVGRLHTAAESLAEVTRLRRAGMAEVGVDLIAGLPFQTAESWRHSLETAASSGATHLSVYMLEVDEDSRLGREVLAGGTRFHAHSVASDDLIAELYETACDSLPGLGFRQYEISNFAQRTNHDAPGEHESRHNRKYWERAPYLGFGLDAHSMLFRNSDGATVRFANSDHMHDYNMGVPATKPAVATLRGVFEESVFLGLRLSTGLCSQSLRASFPWEWVDGYEAVAAELCSEGLMNTREDRRRLTVRGRLLSNEVFGRLLEAVPAS